MRCLYICLLLTVLVVTVAVLNTCGAGSKSSVSDPLPAKQSPVAKLSVIPISGTAPLTVTASTAGSSDPDGTIASYKIDFGDGTVANSGSASHTYSSAGTFTVSGTVTDNGGASSSASATVSVSPATTGAWRPPIGIPAPSFGIAETAPARPAPWEGDVANYYYVQGDASCSDSHTYGNPLAPRCTIPLTLRAGAVVELHGTYTQGHTGSTAIEITGTAAQPVYIRGFDNAANRPVITTHLSIYGYYAVVENIFFDHRALTAAGGSPDIGVPAMGTGSPNCASDVSAACSHHIVFRHTEMQGSTGVSSFKECGGFNVGGWMTDLPVGSNQHDFVFWDNNVHDEGQTNPATDEDQPCKAFNVGRYANHIWIVDNQCYNLAQNCVQIVPTNDGAASNDTHHIYVGRNVASKVGKAAFFAKASSDVIFSQNVAHDPVAKTYSPAVCYGWQYGPQRIWFLYNEGYNCAYGVFGGSDNLGPNQHIYIVGNIFHDITNDGVYNSTFDPANTWSAAAIMSASGTDLHIVNNVIWRINQANGISITQTGFSGSHEIVNNIVGNFLNSNSRDLIFDDEGEFSRATINYNLFYPSPSSLLVWDGGGQLTSISALKSAGKCANCQIADPLFVNAAASDFHLRSGSPAIDKGTLASVIAAFDQYYSASEFGGQKNIIAVDRDYGTRPKGVAWDMGPYEY
jgi:PKD repeat protein